MSTTQEELIQTLQEAAEWANHATAWASHSAPTFIERNLLAAVETAEGKIGRAKDLVRRHLAESREKLS